MGGVTWGKPPLSTQIITDTGNQAEDFTFNFIGGKVFDR